MTSTAIDRPAAIRRAMRDLVAEHGFHGSSMAAVAKAAGVATGTAYVHYRSKKELVFATYLEIKSELARFVTARLDPRAEPSQRYQQLWRATFEYLSEDPSRARFLAQLEESPFYGEARLRLAEQGDTLMEEASRSDVVELLVDLPPELLYALSLGLAVRVVAAGMTLSDRELDALIDASWRAVTTDERTGRAVWSR